MRLIECINELCKLAKEQPAVKTIVHNDIYRLNSNPAVDYGVFAYTQGTHREDSEGFVRYEFTLFYVDRLTDDKSNEIEVQSTALDVLGNIIRGFENRYLGGAFETVNYVTFTERFSDECAGAFATVSFQVNLETLCEENY